MSDVLFFILVLGLVYFLFWDKIQPIVVPAWDRLVSWVLARKGE
jgi:hypothetical protein